MAAATTNPVAKDVSNTVVIIGEYNGKPTVAMAPEGKPFQGLQAGMAKWGRLFGLDKDGDSALLEVFKVVLANAENKDKVIEDMGTFVGKVQEYIISLTEAEEAPKA